MGSLAANASATATIVVSPSTLDPVTNQVMVSAFDIDPNLANNSSSIVSTVNAFADLAVSAIASPSPAMVGGNLTYTVTVTNLGPLTASSVVLTNKLPSGPAYVSAQSTQGSCSRTGSVVTCNLGSITNGAAAKVTIIVTPAAEGTLTNVSGVNSSGVEPTLANNVATTITSVLLLVDAALLVADAPEGIARTLAIAFSVLNYGTRTITEQHTRPRRIGTAGLDHIEARSSTTSRVGSQKRPLFLAG